MVANQYIKITGTTQFGYQNISKNTSAFTIDYIRCNGFCWWSITACSLLLASDLVNFYEKTFLK